MPGQKWTEEDLRQSIALSKTWKEVCDKLGLKECGTTRLRKIADSLLIDYSHFRWNRTYSKEELTKVVANSRSYRQVLLSLGRDETGSAYRFVKNKIKELELDISHFSGKGWNKGNKSQRSYNVRPLSYWLIENSTCTNFTSLKNRILREGLLKNECYICGQQPLWYGKPLVLELDHINGVKNDNRIQNLRILCPHCHSQTDNFAGKNCKTKQ